MKAMSREDSELVIESLCVISAAAIMELIESGIHVNRWQQKLVALRSFMDGYLSPEKKQELARKGFFDMSAGNGDILRMVIRLNPL